MAGLSPVLFTSLTRRKETGPRPVSERRTSNAPARRSSTRRAALGGPTPPRITRRRRRSALAVPVRVRPLALQLDVHLPLAEALGFESANGIVVVEVVVIFLVAGGTQQPVDVAEAQSVEEGVVASAKKQKISRAMKWFMSGRRSAASQSGFSSSNVR